MVGEEGKGRGQAENGERKKSEKKEKEGHFVVYGRNRKWWRGKTKHWYPTLILSPALTCFLEKALSKGRVLVRSLSWSHGDLGSSPCFAT